MAKQALGPRVFDSESLGTADLKIKMRRLISKSGAWRQPKMSRNFGGFWGKLHSAVKKQVVYFAVQN